MCWSQVSIQQADCEKDLAAAIPLVEQAEAKPLGTIPKSVWPFETGWIWRVWEILASFESGYIVRFVWFG